MNKRIRRMRKTHRTAERVFMLNYWPGRDIGAPKVQSRLRASRVAWWAMRAADIEYWVVRFRNPARSGLTPDAELQLVRARLSRSGRSRERRRGQL
jgi:hypothetical protein